MSCPVQTLIAPSSHCLCIFHIDTLMRTERIFATQPKYTSQALPKATPSWQRRNPGETERVSSKRRLTAKQERQRIEGLRILARIIARHYLANPHLYRNGSATSNGRAADGGESVREEGSA